MLSPVQSLRKALGLTLAEMGERCGISKSQMHEVERSGRASLPVALRIEELSQGAIDAGDLNDDVRAARHGVGATAAERAA
jgi:transcriptional regulator with XRE-family HTH domain